MRGIRVAIETDVGCVREQNEDFFGYFQLNNDTVLFIVCDGMGGHEAGEVAAKIAVQSFLHYFANHKEAVESPLKHLKKAFNYANEQILKAAEADPKKRGMGTTAAVAIIQHQNKQQQAFYGHIGDSRIYWFHQNTLKRLTKDHSYVQMLIDQNIITEEESRYHPQRHLITQALGLETKIEPEIATKPLILSPGDQLLLCTDGLINLVEDQEIAEVLRQKHWSEEQKVQTLIHLAKERGGYDNITIILAAVDPIAALQKQ